jgi:hypothetical protein|tara:strand:- start:4691 stop:5194 length:504 start_codon:yes stop_codon:yes gene_type:complete
MATKLIGVSKMKVNEIIAEGLYDASPFAKKMAAYGRTIQQLGQGTGEPGSLKKMSDEELDMMNKMGRVGGVLTTVGATFGVRDPSEKGEGSPKEKLAKMFQEIEKKTGADKAMVMAMINKADKAGDISRANTPDPEPDSDDDIDPDDIAPKDDDERDARDADDAARG